MCKCGEDAVAKGCQTSVGGVPLAVFPGEGNWSKTCEDVMYHFNREKRSREDVDAISFTITPSRPTTDLVLNRRSSIERPLNSCMNK